MNRTLPRSARATAPQAMTTLGLLLTLSGGAWAQPVPSGGDIQRSLEAPLRAEPRPADAAPVFGAPRAPAAAQSSAQAFTVKGVQIKGASVYTNEVLHALVADLVGRSVTVADLQAAANRITDRYQENGYSVARCVLPAQDIRDGVVEFLVLEGRVGRWTIDNRSRIDDASVRRMLDGTPVGEALHEPSLERRLLLLGETPGATRATVVLKPGAQTGETDLAVTVEPSPKYTGQIDVDNHGNRYTGYHRVSGLLNLNSPLGVGDQAQLRLLLTDDNLRNVRLAYQLPLGNGDWQAGASWSHLSYRLGREFAPLGAYGTAEVTNAFVGYALVRSVDLNVRASLGIERKRFADSQDTLSPVPVDKIVDSVGLTLNGYGNWRDAAYTWATVITHGQLDIRTLTERIIDSDPNSAQTQGSFQKWVATGNARWALTPNWSLYGAFYGQLASKNLNASEKITLGGASAVRAYPQGEASGDEGYVVSAEVRYSMPLPGLQFTGFVDVGGVRINERPFSAADNGRTLSGAGLAVTWQPRTDLVWRLMWASRLGSEPVLSEPRNSRSRFWLQAAYRF